MPGRDSLQGQCRLVDHAGVIRYVDDACVFSAAEGGISLWSGFSHGERNCES